ncbi:unnamed protein product [Caenorhabditis bovis]|uniref:Uncharacterized protein n=1 Tax=Caenorhabditis bovis TaxID=2654633 RepID=A0A8S1EFJ6_9PELO|nr:unnamed protein product [Caenorhabditis bovis]
MNFSDSVRCIVQTPEAAQVALFICEMSNIGDTYGKYLSQNLIYLEIKNLCQQAKLSLENLQTCLNAGFPLEQADIELVRTDVSRMCNLIDALAKSYENHRQTN